MGDICFSLIKQQYILHKKIFFRIAFKTTLANQKQELPLAAIFVGGMGRNEETL
jgi:hypothetical protein